MVAPWLEDLDEDWAPPVASDVQSADSRYREAATPSALGSRAPRTSSGRFSIPSIPTASNQDRPSSALEQSALEQSALEQKHTKLPVSPSASCASAGSVVRYGTVERTGKASPHTLEWKKRLIDGELGYGDQTDLFGPSGLENIFQSPSRPTTANSSQPSQPLRMLFKQHDFPPSIPPSSPPPWPSAIDVSDDSSLSPQRTCQSPSLDQVLPEPAEKSSPEPSVMCAPDTSPYQLPGLAQSASNRGLLKPSTCSQPANRTFSAMTDYSGEGFSPVFLTKLTTLDGRVNYAAVDAKNANRNQPHDDISDQSLLKHDSDHLPTELSLLPENLPTGTPPPATLGDFVSVKRGGLSQQGSFKTRPLSPSQHESLPASATADDSFEKNDDSQSDILSPLSPPKRPATPVDRDDSTLLSPSLSAPKTRPSISPLKLFGNYDTFTNNRLLRRMSQLEDVDQVELNDGRVTSNTSSSNSNAVDSIAGRLSRKNSTPAPGLRAGGDHQSSHCQIRPSLGSFGEGQFDEHDFEADLSIPSALDFSQDDFSDRSPPPQIAPPGSRIPFRFHLEESPDQRHSLQLKRKLSKRSTARSRVSAEYASVRPEFYAGQAEDNQYVEGKRPRSSPSKAPTPKRRRTIVALNGAFPGLGHGSEIQVKITGASTDGSRTASLEGTGSWNGTSSSRSRLRGSTSIHHREEDIHEGVGEATMQFLSSSPRLEAVKEKLDLTDITEESLTAEQAQSVAAEVAAFTLNVPKSEHDGKRSRSITTQDFLDEAMHIMSLIRAKGRPISRLGNLEESYAEDSQGPQSLLEDDPASYPSPLRLSRPPSREGGSTGWRTRNQKPQDPRVASQLRKFQETDNELELVESSLHSLNMNDLESHSGQTAVNALSNTLSNLRFRGSHPVTGRPRGESDLSRRSKGASSKTHGSNPSLDSSSSRRTEGTHSTRKSDNVATLAPETVAHLIPEEVGGMTFDREKQKWVRVKSPQKVHREMPASPTPPSNIASDDDPFNDIPDLTVDEMKELSRIGRSPTRESCFYDQGSALPTHCNSRANSNNTTVTRPVTRENQVAPPFNSSSVPSKVSAFGSSKHFSSSHRQVETRATSYSDEDFTNMKRSKSQPSQGLLDIAYADMPHSISDIAENLEEDDQFDNDDSLPIDDELTEELPAPRLRQQQQPRLHPTPGSMFPRQGSLRRKTLNRGLHANAQDQSEMSFVATLPDKRLMSVSVNLSRPSAKHAAANQDLIVPASSPARVDATFYLSDLPDFTVNEVDEERPSEKALAKRISQHAANDRYDMALQGLVRTLQDVEPDEPYWEDIKQLSLRERDLSSIHNLEDFCTRLEDLDLSNNNITHLEGAPCSIRRLNVRSNALSSLTAWSHLSNLQYLDISGNSIDNLAGLSMLVHLREVRADDNQISSLDGIMGLDGLLKLSVRRNNLTSVVFEGCELERLEELDLSGNQLTDFSYAESLPSLSRLILDDNELASFGSEVCTSRLTCLSLQKNQLQTLNVCGFAGLRYLNVDENRLSSIQGLDRLLHVDTLSMRKQRVSALSIFEQQLHARSLNLSSNTITNPDLPHIYNSVQDLELASCGLQELPLDFGLKFPNLQTINLGFNALKDLRPLLNIPRLHTLRASGNRISRLRKTTATLARMQHLRQFDIRDNPITLGFYPPTATAAVLTTAMNEQCLVPSPGRLPEDLDSETESQIQKRAARAYLLPHLDRVADTEHCGRLDKETKLTRRVYELMLAQSCGALEYLDGMPFDRTRVAVRDDIWDRLIELGVMRKSNKSEAETMRVGTPLCELEV